MRKRHKKALLKRRICPACKRSLGQWDCIQYVDSDMKIRCPHPRCRRVNIVLQENKQVWVLK